MPVQFNTEPDVLDSAPYDTHSLYSYYSSPHFSSYNSRGSNYTYSDDGTRSSEIFSAERVPTTKKNKLDLPKPKFGIAGRVASDDSYKGGSTTSSTHSNSTSTPYDLQSSDEKHHSPKKDVMGTRGGPQPSGLRKDHPKFLPEIEAQKDKGYEIMLLREQIGTLRTNCEKFIDEIQKLDIRNNKLETENANLNFKVGTDTDKSSAGADGSTNYFQMGDADLQRRCLEMETVIRQLNSEKSAWMREVEEKAKENKDLKDNVKDLLLDIEIDEKIKAKKKTWYGAKKKVKLGEAALTANELRDKLDMDAEMDMETSTLDKARNKQIKKSGALADHQRNEIQNYKRQIERLQDQIKMAQEERVRLEKEKAKYEGEALILQKERWGDKDKLSKLETHNELLKNQQRHAATETALTYSRAIQIPLPDREGHTELDRLRVMVQLQEDALRRVTVQRDQLVDMMDQTESNVATALGNDDIKRSEAEMTRLNKQLTCLIKEKGEVNDIVKRLKVVVTNLEGDNGELKKTVQHLSHNLSKSAQVNNQVKQKQAVMLGQALTANEDLAAQVAKMSAYNVDELMSVNGEIQTVFTGRTNESASKYALNKKLYPAVTAKRYHETHPTIEKGSLVTSVAQTDPLMISLAAHNIHHQSHQSHHPHHINQHQLYGGNNGAHNGPDGANGGRNGGHNGAHNIPIGASLSSGIALNVPDSDTMSEVSYAYTYVEEEVIVPRKVLSPRKGIQMIPGGHGGNTRAARHGDVVNLDSSACRPAAANLNARNKGQHDDYETIARDIHGQQLASKALKAWNADYGARRQLV